MMSPLLRPAELVGRSVVAVLLGIAAVVLAVLAPGGRAAAVSPPAISLSVDPTHGAAGSTATVGGKGYESCLDVSLSWDGGGSVIHPTVQQDGSISRPFPVPADAPPGPHTIWADCTYRTLAGAPSGGGGASGASGAVGERIGSVRYPAYFTVDEPTSQARLTLSTAQGRPGDAVDLVGTGFRCGGGTVLVSWDATALGTLTPAGDGGFRTRATVPRNAAKGPHTLRAACTQRPDIAAAQPYTVVAAGTVTTPPPTPGPTVSPADGPVLSTDPARGDAGQSVRVTGSRFGTCAAVSGTVLLSWDGAPAATTATVGDDGNLGTSIAVPADADTGSHTLHAACAGLPAVAADAAFTVGGQDGMPVLAPALGGGLLLAGAAAVTLGRRRGPRWASQHIAAEQRTGRPGGVQVEETAVEGGDRTRTVRLQPHPDPGSQQLEEPGSPGGTEEEPGSSGRTEEEPGTPGRTEEEKDR
ncbi:hypothetical protein GCM10010440_23080 [Kitasatospora cinereorecta]